MKPNQKHNPKYWVFHNKTEDEIYMETSHKSFEGCANLTRMLFPEVYDAFISNDERYSIDLFEINPVVK